MKFIMPVYIICPVPVRAGFAMQLCHPEERGLDNQSQDAGFRVLGF